MRFQISDFRFQISNLSNAIAAVVAMYGAFMLVGWLASRKAREGTAADLIVAGRAILP